MPNLDTLPESQQIVWPMLRATPPDFVLYAGTALALRLGHRVSVDFDFFSRSVFSPMSLVRSVSYLVDRLITQQAVDTLSCEIATDKGPVKISYFGGLSLRQIEVPDVAPNGIAVASLTDLFGMKCATVPQRNEPKDYLDIHALLGQAGMTLSHGIAAAAAIYGRQYNPLLTLQALSYFKDLPEALPEEIKANLLSAVKSVALEDRMSSPLDEVALHVNWYMPPERLLADTDLFLCQVMARGSAADIVATRRHYADEDFRKAYRNAPPGLFTKRAWAYWGLVLFDAPDRDLPERFPGANRLDWRGPAPG